MTVAAQKAQTIRDQIRQVCQENELWFTELEENKPQLKDIKFEIIIRVEEPVRKVTIKR